jgi:hypothetical protein
MRYEMPCSYADFIGNFVAATPAGGYKLRTPDALLVAPAIANSYLAQVNAASANGATFTQIEANQSAECLFLTLTIGSTDSGMFGEQLPNQDIGDVDGDGLPEFQDAWRVASSSFTPKGNANSPIDFIRWAPGYISELQPDPSVPNVSQFSLKYHDYFDPLKLDIPSGPGDTPRGLQLTPLIYSAGPDGIWGIAGVSGNADPYDATGVMAGAPNPADPTGADADNVTNHSLDTRSGR